MSRHYFSFSSLSRLRKPAPYLFCDLLCFSIQKGSVLFFGEKEKKERKEECVEQDVAAAAAAAAKVTLFWLRTNIGF